MEHSVSNLIPESEGHNIASSAIESIANMNLPRFTLQEFPEFLFVQEKEIEE